MARVPVVKVGGVLVATLNDDLDDVSAMDFQSYVAERVVDTKASGVLLDISVLGIVDSFISKMLSDTAAMVRLLGAEVAVVGMQPAVAITLVELGLTLNSITTVRTLDEGLKELSRRTALTRKAGSGDGLGR